jgi:peptidoglycan-N-acetylglucosamine deacetylase
MMISRAPSLYQSALSRLKDPENVYLTFDDGPHPEATVEALEALDKHNLKATFFMLGENCRDYPAVARNCAEHGHAIGNHGEYHRRHVRGFTRDFESIDLAQQHIHESTGVTARYFRPPYGAWLPGRKAGLKSRGLKLVLWSCMPGDFRVSSTSQRIFKHFLRTIEGGDIIVLHDNEKTKYRMRDNIAAAANALDELGLSTKTLHNL